MSTRHGNRDAQQVLEPMRRDEPERLGFVQLELTNACNCRCQSCPQSVKGKPGNGAPYDRPTGFISRELFKKVAEDCYRWADEINFSFFGEPSLHPDYIFFLRALKDRPASLALVMNTNLTRLTREHFDVFREVGVNELRLSIDAATLETYEKIRAGTDYVDLEGGKTSKSRFETVMEKARYWFSLPDHCPTRHVFTLGPENFKEARAFVERWQPLLGEKDSLLVKNVITYGGVMQNSFVKGAPCNIFKRERLTVSWDGRVSLCNLDVNMAINVGDANSENLMEIRRSEKFRRIRAEVETRSCLPCRFCPDSNNPGRQLTFSKEIPWDSKAEESFAVLAG